MIESQVFHPQGPVPTIRSAGCRSKRAPARHRCFHRGISTCTLRASWVERLPSRALVVGSLATGLGTTRYQFSAPVASVPPILDIALAPTQVIACTNHIHSTSIQLSWASPRAFSSYQKPRSLGTDDSLRLRKGGGTRKCRFQLPAGLSEPHGLYYPNQPARQHSPRPYTKPSRMSTNLSRF